jgi:uncharacterized protein (TIGR00255 family)
MTIKSMTGFARTDGSAGSTSWHWEVRSVNGRGLDLRLRLPPGFEGLEPRIREAVAKRLVRGSLSVNLNVRRSEGVSQIRLNEAALRQVLAALDKLQAMATVEAPRADGLLGIRGVLEFAEAEEGEGEARARTETMLASLEQALEGLVAARSSEGRRLEEVIVAQLVAIEKLVGAVQRSPARTPEAIRQRLKEQLARLLEPGVPLDEVRLYQEAALLATRARRGGAEAARCAYRRRARVAGLERAGRASPGFPGPGVQPRGQHPVLEGQRCRDDAGRPGAEGRYRSDARAGAEH